MMCDDKGCDAMVVVGFGCGPKTNLLKKMWFSSLQSF